MASLQRIIFIALIFTIAIPISTADDDDRSEKESCLRDLCSETKNSEECWKIIEPKLDRFSDMNATDVASVVFDLAIEKSDQIHNKLDDLHKDSNDDKLKDKYKKCSKNYNDAKSDLDHAKGNLDSDDVRNIRIDDIKQELKDCNREFNKDSSDPPHIRNMNMEFGYYLEIVKVAVDRLVKERDRDH